MNSTTFYTRQEKRQVMVRRVFSMNFLAAKTRNGFLSYTELSEFLLTELLKMF
jgi:hypothetical protein